jgi:inorganic pyrophosphatase
MTCTARSRAEDSFSGGTFPTQICTCAGLLRFLRRRFCSAALLPLPIDYALAQWNLRVTLTVVFPNLYDMDPGADAPEIVRMIVEIPKNSPNKYEYDGKLGLFRMDRALYSPLHYPGDYGFIPGTLAEDHDPMDVLTLVSEGTFTGCLLEVRPVGILNMEDNAEGDQKVLAVPRRDPRYDQIHTMDQIFPHVRREIEHFFTIYKELENRVTRMRGWGGPAEARRTIMESRQRYLDSKLTEAAAAE